MSIPIPKVEIGFDITGSNAPLFTLDSATKGVHRTNGPAKIHINGKKEYWIDNIPMPADAFFLKYGVL